MGKNIIGITGGSGYIGSSLAKHFAKFFEVKLVDVKSPVQSFQGNVNFQKCDVRDYDEVRKSLKDVDLVIHTSIIQIPAINEQKKFGYEVNINGTENVCKAVEENEKTKGLILCGSWHTIGEKELKGIINEQFGFRPDMVEDRARLYALSKIAQESIVRFYDEMTTKIYGIIRMGTVIGEGMPEKTAANIFIENGIKGKPLTPYRNSMYRPMLYVDIDDICKVYRHFAEKIIKNEIKKNGNSMSDIFNVYYPEPVTILELAQITKEAIINYSNGKIQPEIKIVETGQPSIFEEKDKTLIQVDAKKVLEFFNIKQLKSPKQSIETLVKKKLSTT